MNTAFLWLWISAVAIVCIGLIRSDLRDRLLPNSLVLALTVISGIPLFPLFNAGPTRVTTTGRSVAFGLVFLIIALFVHQRGLIGGGDAKASLAVGLLVSYFSSSGWLVYLATMIISAATILFWSTRTTPENKNKGLPLGPVFLTGIAPALALSLGFGFQ